MEAFIARLAQSSEVVIVLVLGIVGLYRMLQAEKKESKSDRTSHKKDLKHLNESHAAAVKILNEYISKRDNDNLDLLVKLETHLSTINTKLIELDSKLK